MNRLTRQCLCFAAATVAAQLAHAAQTKILLPLGRHAYQTNEQIELAIVRSDTAPLPAGDMIVKLTADDASQAQFSFPLKPVPVDGNEARTTEHLRLAGWLLRPANYKVEISADGATASAQFELHPHLRRSTFKLIDWGSRAKGEEQGVLGEDSMGFNLNYAAYGGIDADNMIRGGLDYMRNCTMSGAHQMDLRMECDWSDPYVLIGAEARVVREALASRNNPNCVGVHLYDEPGLTWWKHAKTGVQVPYNLPSQDRSYKADFGVDAPQYNDVKPDDAQAVEQWKEMNRWKLGFMDATWKYSSFGVSFVRPDLLSVTQSVYGYSAYADGYYFNVVRSLPVISGHGGYSDWGYGLWNPVSTFEFGRMRDLNKPNWYLPTWSSNMPANQFRMEQYMSFMMNLQGMAKPPDAVIHTPWNIPAEAPGIVESNRLMEKLGTIFEHMPVDRGPVALLYSMSTILDAEVKDMQTEAGIQKSAYEGGGHSREKINLAYLAGKAIHQNLFPIVEEDILDGTLAAHHKAVFLAGVNALEPKVTKALEEYIQNGGLVIVSDDSKVKIKGATPLGVAITTEPQDKVKELQREKKEKEVQALETSQYYYDAAMPIAKALRGKLEAAGIKPPLDSNSTGVVTSHQGQGDVEYLFAVNATWDEKEGKRNSIKSTTAKLMLPAGGMIYDAVHGMPASEFKPDGKQLVGEFRFGPGQMRMFARTARPIGAVQVQTPTLFKDFTAAKEPIHINISAAVVDDAKMILSGEIPLQIRLIDPLGVVRYELYRATDQGTFKGTLPLAANDPAGTWKLTVKELLSSKESQLTFDYNPASQCGALAGLIPRAVFFGNDRENAFRFFRLHHDVTIVKGTSPYNDAAAQRLAQILKPWNVHCAIITAAEANQPRELSPEETPTWVGLEPGRLKVGDKTHPNQVGFALRGPAILLGTPDDNPLIKFAAEKKFLPYAVDKLNFPGHARGMIAWQRDAISYGDESLTLISYDEAGMSQAVGTIYECAAALDPLMPLNPPQTARVNPAKQSTRRGTDATIAWRVVLPDRAVSLALNGGGLKVTTNDGSAFTLSADGKLSSRSDAQIEPVDPKKKATPVKAPQELAEKVLPLHVIKFVESGTAGTAIGYWGGRLEVFDSQGSVKISQNFGDDIDAIAWLDRELVISTSDGSVVGIGVK